MRLSRALLALFALPAAAGVAAAQSRITITDLGPGAAGRILREALSRPHKLVPPDTAPLIQRRGETERTSLVVLDRTVYIGGKVEGDVIVVDGDLFVRVGAEITGRAIAIGGGVYPSALAYVGGGTQAFHEQTFDVAPQAEGYRLSYRSLLEASEPPLFLPGIAYGVRVPSYDRVNGLSIPFGPALTLGTAEINTLVTYRSDLGEFDPSLTLDWQLTRRSRLEGGAGIGSFTNDAWIYPDYLNSLSSLVFGEDTRNWYRAVRAELSLHRTWEMTRSVLEPFVGGRIENSRPIGPTVGDSTGPWSLFGRKDTLGMRRPNPQVAEIFIPSVVAGTAFRWEEEQGLLLRARTAVEKGAVVRDDPTVIDGGFLQATTDFDLRFPTFGEQQYRIEIHWVTSGGTVPLQRFTYLGGPGTMPFMEILEQGGGELLLVDQRYSIPLTRIVLPLFGIPTLQLRHRLGSAGVSELPPLAQMIGVGVSLTVIRGEVRFDPASGKVKFTTGFTFAR